MKILYPLLFLLGFSTAWADGPCVLSGEVLNREQNPVAAAKLTLKRDDGKSWEDKSDEQGHFNVRYEPFGNSGFRSLTLVNNAKGYEEGKRLLFKEANDCVKDTEKIVLTLNADMVAAPSNYGLTIYLAPSQIYDKNIPVETKLDENMPEFIIHRIITYKSKLGNTVLTAGIDISVKMMTEPLKMSEAERIKSVGRKLNALGIVVSDGEYVSNEVPRKIQLRSVFRTIPSFNQIEVAHHSIEDTVPEAGLASAIGDGLHVKWGRQAVLSYVLSQLAVSTPDLPGEKKERLIKLLVAVREEIKDKEDLLFPVTQGLLESLGEPAL